jgi:3D-(3,5/4)-trihydroxycyclohexane-1,2-dione acylhydrolase (decyclizing)
MVGDGSYLMLNSEIATSVMLGHKLIIVVQDNRGYGCINRLHQACGSAPFNNLYADCVQGPFGAPHIDFAAHAAALGARAEHVQTIAELEAALARARASDRTYLISIDTDPNRVTEDGGCWWEVAVPEVSARSAVRAARADYQRSIDRRAHRSANRADRADRADDGDDPGNADKNAT